MRYIKKIAVISLAMLVVLGGTQADVFAATQFAPFTFSTTPNSECYYSVVTASKANQVMNWNVTFTLAAGVPGSMDPPLVVSGKKGDNLTSLPPVEIGMGSRNGSYRDVSKTNYTMYASGNENNPYSYTVTIAGYYTP